MSDIKNTIISNQGDHLVKMVFDEAYGELSFAQRAAYRKHNVSPSDHDMLADRFGAGAHARITTFVKEHSEGGLFRFPFGL